MGLLFLKPSNSIHILLTLYVFLCKFIQDLQGVQCTLKLSNRSTWCPCKVYALESLFTVHFELYEASMCSAETAYTAPYDMCTKVDKNSLYSEHNGAKCTVLNALCCTGCLDLLGVHVQCIVHIGVCVHQS